MHGSPTIHLSFDVEEFDLPNEYGGNLSLEQQLEHGRLALEHITPWLSDLDIRTTFFTTARFAEYVPDHIREASTSHEIASHGVRHDAFKDEDYALSKKQLEALTGETIHGFRKPRLQPINTPLCIEAGYTYDSSENPIRLPGRYDNRDLPRTPRREDELLRIPISTSPTLRIPLFWLSWGNIPRWILRSALQRALGHDGTLILFFHPWEFIEPPPGVPIPRIVRRRMGPRLQDIVDRELRKLAGQATFRSMKDILDDTVC